MDAVGADEHVAARGAPMGAAAIEEIGGDAAVVLRERAEPAIEVDARLAEPRPHGLIDHALKAAAVNGELRNVVTGIDAARLAPDLLAEAIGIEQLVRADGDGVETLEQAEVGQFLDGMRQRIDADAKLADGVRLLENFAVDPARVQHQRRYQAADTASCDDHFHKATPCRRTTRCNTRLLTAGQCAAGDEKCNDLPSAWL